MLPSSPATPTFWARRTHGQPVPIGSLYGFEIVVKTDTTVKEGLDFCESRFFVRGAGKLLYNYNNGRLATDPQTACRNFINAFDSIPRLIEKYTRDNADIEKEIPVLKQVVDETWKKEDEAVSGVHLMKNLATTIYSKVVAKSSISNLTNAFFICFSPKCILSFELLINLLCSLPFFLAFRF